MSGQEAFLRDVLPRDHAAEEGESLRRAPETTNAQDPTRPALGSAAMMKETIAISLAPPIARDLGGGALHDIELAPKPGTAKSLAR